MKLVTAIVHDDDAGKLTAALAQRGFRSTRLHSHGGFLRARNSTVLVGVDDSQLDDALGIIRAGCRTRTRSATVSPPAIDAGEIYALQPVEVDVGGATIFVTHVEHYEQV